MKTIVLSITNHQYACSKQPYIIYKYLEMDGNGMNPPAIPASMSDESPVAGILRLK